jgi:hypothetical protein
MLTLRCVCFFIGAVCVVLTLSTVEATHAQDPTGLPPRINPYIEVGSIHSLVAGLLHSRSLVLF